MDNMSVNTLNLLSSQPYYTLCFGLLACSIISVWAKPGRLWWTLFYIASAAVGYWQSILSENAIIIMAAFWILSYFGYANFKPRSRMISQVIMITLTILLLLHFFEGFEPWIVVTHLQLGHRVVPFTHYIFYEHAFIGVSLLGMGALQKLCYRYPEWKVLIRDTWPIALTAIFSLFILSALSHRVDIDPEWSSYIKIFAVTNLLFVCVSEEAIFRGIIQRPLTEILQRWHVGKFDIGPWVALIITTAIFTLRHYYGGPTVMIYALLTGTFYSYAYLKTRRVESCILVHWCVNLVHFTAFTYPMLA